jgi:hypothetical protein
MPSSHPILTILQSGTYNLGFIGLRRGATSDELLAWWMEKLYSRLCRRTSRRACSWTRSGSISSPASSPITGILHHPGYNAALLRTCTSDR